MKVINNYEKKKGRPVIFDLDVMKVEVPLTTAERIYKELREILTEIKIAEQNNVK